MAKQTKLITKTDEDNNGVELKREFAQKISFEKLKEILTRDVNKNVTRTYLQYTKDLLRTYVLSPNANQDNLREVSRFLGRNSMLYKKLLMYYASMPLFYYNITQINDWSSKISGKKAIKEYQSMLSSFDKFNFKTENYLALYLALRDGMYVGFMYDYGKDGKFFMPLDPKYCRIYGKTSEGQWIVYFNLEYFNVGNNKEFVLGINGSGGTWDSIFIDGYNYWKDTGDKNAQWIRLTPERTFCLITGDEDEFYAPLPFFLPLFDLILANLDLNALIDSRNELENYILLISKLPLMKDSEQVNDFAIDFNLGRKMQDDLDEGLPDLVTSAMVPFQDDIQKITFEKSNSTDSQDELSQSIQNIFNNAGASQLVVAGGASTNSVGLKHAIQNDMATCWVWVNKIESWYNYYISKNYSGSYIMMIHKICWYNQEDYVSQVQTAATLGGSAIDYLTAIGNTPFVAINKLMFENAIGIKNIMIPLQSSYTMSAEAQAGRPQSDDDDLSDEGLATRDGNKNGTE